MAAGKTGPAGQVCQRPATAAAAALARSAAVGGRVSSAWTLRPAANAVTRQAAAAASKTAGGARRARRARGKWGEEGGEPAGGGGDSLGTRSGGSASGRATAAQRASRPRPPGAP